MEKKNNLDEFNFLHKNLLGIDDLSSSDIDFLLNESMSMLKVFRSGELLDILHGRFAINLFFENSTRTLNSFDIAARRLGAQVINVSTRQSSIKKGETLLDTAATLNAMKPDIIVIRHKFAGVPELLANKISCPVINAGDGAHEHPTQALLDALTIKINKGQIKNMKIAICGDILHSRVAYSNIILLNKMQANLHLVAPPTLMPRYVERLNVGVHYRMEPALQDCDIIMMLRLQNERMDGVYLPSAREFYRIYGLDQKKLAKAKQNALIMHPGPTNRGVEIDSSIIDDHRSLIENQVENGVAVRMAIIKCLMQNALKIKDNSLMQEKIMQEKTMQEKTMQEKTMQEKTMQEKTMQEKNNARKK